MGQDYQQPVKDNPNKPLNLPAYSREDLAILHTALVRVVVVVRAYEQTPPAWMKPLVKELRNVQAERAARIK